MSEEWAQKLAWFPDSTLVPRRAGGCGGRGFPQPTTYRRAWFARIPSVDRHSRGDGRGFGLLRLVLVLHPGQ